MTKLILCGCKERHKINKSSVDDIQQLLTNEKIAYTFIEDLCGHVANNRIEIANDSDIDETLVIGCQPKALKNLIERGGIDTSKKQFKYFHIDKFDYNSLENNSFEKGEITTIAYKNEWKPWYPVLDYDLCTHCQKCLNFCLFGVYKLSDEGKVVVENPENCKDLCPACARTCPTNAIVFPKHHEAPIDGGEGIFTDEPEDFLNQIQENKDIYAVLAKRRKASGVSLFKADQLKIAEQERKQCNCKNDGN